jgi:S1-C subfamily serine protease
MLWAMFWGLLWRMRTSLAVVVVIAASAVACAPAVAPKGPSTYFDEDLPSEHTATEAPTTATASTHPAARVDAPRGKGTRSGTIDRGRLVAVLDGGPASFLRQIEVSARLQGDRFIGWQLVQVLDREGALADVDVAPGDVLLAINGKPVAKPDQLQTLWDSLRTANQIVAELTRGDAKVELVFDVQPKL